MKRPAARAGRRTTATLHLASDARSALYLALGQQLDAGLDAARALAGAHGIAGGPLDGALARASSAVARGQTLAASGRSAGLWAGPDLRLIDHAEQVGASARAFLMLAESYRKRFERERRVRGRLLMPGLVLGVGLLAAPLPRLAAGTLGAGGYLLAAFGPLAAIALASIGVRAAARRAGTHGARGWLRAAARALPGGRTVALAHDRARVLDVVAMRLRAGMPAGEALAGLSSSVVDARLAAGLTAASKRTAGGAGVTEALLRAGLIEPSADHALLSTSEAAGRIDEGMTRAADDAAARLDALYELVADWAPRIAYALVVVWVARGLL